MLPHVFTYISVSSTPATVLRLTSRSISIFLRTTTHSWQTWSQNWGDKSPAFSIKAALILWYRYVLPWFLNKKNNRNTQGKVSTIIELPGVFNMFCSWWFQPLFYPIEISVKLGNLPQTEVKKKKHHPLQSSTPKLGGKSHGSVNIREV